MKKLFVFLLFFTVAIRPVKVSALTVDQESGTWKKLATPVNFYAMEVTPAGIFGGEYQPYSINLYNGIYVSKNLGDEWSPTGLRQRGVTGIAYDSKSSIYATVYYWITMWGGTSTPPGIYKSNDQGRTWTRGALDFSSAAVATCNNHVIVGSYSHGLWVSPDSGGSWIKKKDGDTRVGSADFLTLITSKNIVLASNKLETYISYDCGDNWQLYTDIPYPVSGFETHNSVYMSCHPQGPGIFKSSDSGKTYQPLAGWENKPCYSIVYYEGVYYAASYSEEKQSYIVLKSSDYGTTWDDLNFPLNSNPINKLSRLSTDPGFIYANLSKDGVYRYKVVAENPVTFSFLDKLWGRNSMSEQTDTITSYFDHSYPLLGYPYKTEGEEESSTTTNFWGVRGKEPNVYYSSHDGIDFGLRYGTPILAPASGTASYSFSSAGGNTIKVNHQNGYQTQYLHLQKNGLFTVATEEKWINKGDRIGLIGLTGITTGPHLHFAVRQDKNRNNNFSDDVPDGRVDPYSWLSKTKQDPWELFSWTDKLGSHKGTQSVYLWKDFLTSSSLYLNEQGGSVLGSATELRLPAGAINIGATFSIRKASGVNVAYNTPDKLYIAGSAIIIEARDNTGTSIGILNNLADLHIDLSSSNLSGITAGTLKIYYFNEVSQTWEVVTSLWDSTTSKMTAYVTRMGEYAVFGDKSDYLAPSTSTQVSGEKEELWYITSPTVSLAASDNTDGSGIEHIFYSTDGGNSWEEYLNPLVLNKEGIFSLLSRSSDKAQNFEVAKDSELLRVNTTGKFTDEISLSGGTFKLGTF